MTRVARRQAVIDSLRKIAEESQGQVLTFLEGRRATGQVREVRSFWVFNGLAVTADAETLLSVAARPEVRVVRLDRWRRWVNTPPLSESRIAASDHGLAAESESSIEWNIARVEADQAWTALALDGTGVTVAIMDTGVDWQHPALQMQYRGYKPNGLTVHDGNWTCTTDENYQYPVDGYGHGTHVTGIAVGSRDGDDRAIGVAPGAQWIAAKMLNDAGFGYDSWIHAAFEWLMAPSSDPALAPDVVNASWGSPEGLDETFRADVQALRAANIVPIFAAGNDGPGTSSIGSPASYPEAIAVGATDDLDQVANFSSRGPSGWNETKPEVAAPGVQIWSTLPGGTYALHGGTSMAAPHVAGLAALALQGDPDLSVDQLEAILTSTSLPLGELLPNNDTGWGRINAYRAASVAMEAGFLAGHLTGQQDLEPLVAAQVVAYDRDGAERGRTETNDDGDYWLALPPERYNLVASAFGFASETTQDVWVQSGVTVTLDMTLLSLPVGTVSGDVISAETGEPVEAKVWAVGTPAWTTSDPRSGRYRLDLPTGTYTLDISQNGYRRYTVASVKIVAGRELEVNAPLASAATVLFVDSGRWYYRSQASYFEQALDDNGWVYDLWEIRDPVADRPELEELAAYDIAVWSSPLDSPGLIGAGDVISGYLSAGGSILLTGQDIGYWDGGLDVVGLREYYRRFLKAKATDDDAGRSDVEGAPGQVLKGLTLSLNGPDSAQNQVSPDAISLLDPRDAAIVARYRDGGNAALSASACQSYRALYLAAGLEGLGDRTERAEVMERSLTWLGSDKLGVGSSLYPASQNTVWLQDRVVTYTVELRNDGKLPDRFMLGLSGSDWDSSVWDAAFSQQLVESLQLSPCATQTLGLRVLIPPQVSWNSSDVVTLTARSLSDPGIYSEAVFQTKAPAPVLLVDDHVWYDVSDRYRSALDSAGLQYDTWRIEPSSVPGVLGPSLERMQRYRVAVWFTAYDWYATLTPTDEERLAAYLDGGGRLLLSSQDYLYTSGFTPFAGDYLGVDGYTEALTATQVVGAIGNPIGDGLDIAHLTYPYRNWSDALHASEHAQPALWGQHAQPVALTLDQPPWKTAFFSFPLEALPEQDLADVVSRTVDWLSPLGDSVLSVDRSAAAEGEELAYRLLAQNTGPALLSQVSLSNTLPTYATLVPGTIQGPATYDPATRRLNWVGAIAPGDQVEIRYRLLLDSPLPEGISIRNVAHLADESGLALNRTAKTRVNAPDLSHSTMLASARTTVPGKTIVYTFHLSNNGTRSAQVRLTDPVPLNAEYQPGTAWANTGTLTDTAEAVFWSGTIAPGGSVTIEIPVVPAASSAASYILNRATLNDGWGQSQDLEAYTWVEVRLFFPIIGQR